MNDFFVILKRFVSPYKKYLVLNIVFNLLAAFMTLFSFALIIPILQMLFGVNTEHYEWIPLTWENFRSAAINDFYYFIQSTIFAHGASATLAMLGLMLVLMTGLKCGTTYLASYFIIPMRSGVVRDIRNTIYDKVVSLPIGFFTNEHKGDVIARMTGDVSAVENSIMQSIDLMCKNPLMIIACLSMMIAISWQLTLFVLILLPLAGYIMGTVGRKLKSASFATQNKWGQIMSNIEETLGGLRIIKAFVAEQKVSDRFHR
ncbi:MAG: ABC transporter ATP-binding protein, partial [Muribaculaceae bacterium]|nr:ABC transporter ATP-binding protein [Muribaculaceae bacterium]